jgi:hypothetical protein
MLFDNGMTGIPEILTLFCNACLLFNQGYEIQAVAVSH